MSIDIDVRIVHDLFIAKWFAESITIKSYTSISIILNSHKRLLNI